MTGVYAGYALVGLGCPLLAAGMLLFVLVFMPRRGGPPLAALSMHHPAFIAAAVMAAIGLCLVLLAATLMSGPSLNTRRAKRSG